MPGNKNGDHTWRTSEASDILALSRAKQASTPSQMMLAVITDETESDNSVCEISLTVSNVNKLGYI